MITKEKFLEAQETIKLYEEQVKQERLNRTYVFGDIVKAKCTAVARAINNGKCVYVSAMSNELMVDDVDMTADWSNDYNLPIAAYEDLRRIDTRLHGKIAYSQMIAEWIQNCLKDKSWSQRELAEALDKTDAEISKWLSGTHNFTINTIEKIEAVLDKKLIPNL